MIRRHKQAAGYSVRGEHWVAEANLNGVAGRTGMQVSNARSTRHQHVEWQGSRARIGAKRCTRVTAATQEARNCHMATTVWLGACTRALIFVKKTKTMNSSASTRAVRRGHHCGRKQRAYNEHTARRIGAHGRRGGGAEKVRATIPQGRARTS